MWNKALSAKYSVSFCLPFLSGTFLSPALLTAALEEKLKELLKEFERQRDKGEWNVYWLHRTGQKKYGKWCKEMVALVF